MFRTHSHIKWRTRTNTSLIQQKTTRDDDSFKSINYVGSTFEVTNELRRRNGIFHIQTDSTCWKSASSLLLTLNQSLDQIPENFKNKRNMMALTSDEWTSFVSICGFQKANYPQNIQELSKLCYNFGPLIAITDQDKFRTGESSNIYHLINIVGTINNKPIIVENEARFFPANELRNKSTKYCHVLKSFETLSGLLTSPYPIAMPWEVYIDIPQQIRPSVVINNKITNNPPRFKPVVTYPGIYSLFYLPGLKDKIEAHAEKLTEKELQKIENEFLAVAYDYPKI